MADFDIYLEAPVPGESPYVDVSSPVVAGNINIKIHAGKRDFVQDQHWELVRCVHLLTTSADVANRVMANKFYIVTDDGTEVLYCALIGANNVTATQTGEITYLPLSSLVNIGEYYGNFSGTVRLGGSGEFFLKTIDYLNCYISNGQPADLHHVIATFRYLNYDLGIRFKA